MSTLEKLPNVNFGEVAQCQLGRSCPMSTWEKLTNVNLGEVDQCQFGTVHHGTVSGDVKS